MTFKGNCRKVSSETQTTVKKGENNDETKEEQHENENTEDNDFVLLSFVGKKGKTQTAIFLSLTKYDQQHDI